MEASLQAFSRLDPSQHVGRRSVPDHEGPGRLRAEATPLHKGKRTHVWQTRITDENGKLLSLTTQTQMIL